MGLQLPPLLKQRPCRILSLQSCRIRARPLNQGGCPDYSVRPLPPSLHYHRSILTSIRTSALLPISISIETLRVPDLEISRDSYSLSKGYCNRLFYSLMRISRCARAIDPKPIPTPTCEQFTSEKELGASASINL